MTALTNQKIQVSYGDLVQISNTGNGIDATLRYLSNGLGTNSSMQLSTIAANFTGTFQLNGKTLTIGSNSLTFTTSGVTSLALPTSGTLVTLSGSEILSNKTLTAPIIATIVNTGTLTLPTSTDTLIGKATTDTLTNKTFDTAGTGNVFKVNGTQISAKTGTGSVVLATSPTITSPTLTTPVLGVATATSINKVALTTPATGSTLTIADGKTLTVSNSATISTTPITQITRQVFTSSGTYTPTTGMVYCDVEMVGGGASSGSSPSAGSANASASGGGGAGEYAKGRFTLAQIIGAGTTASIVIGAAGTAPVSGAHNGNNGGNTTLTANAGVGSLLLSAIGGTGSTTGAVSGALVYQSGGAGGTGGSGGDYRKPGQAGFFGMSYEGNSQAIAIGGAGGSSQFGAGGQDQGNATNFAGNAGTGYGSGGGGSGSNGTQAAVQGGAGTAGLVVITEYIAI